MTATNWVVGLILVVLGETFRLAGVAAAGTTTRRRSRNVQRLVTYGAFAWSRNPLYNGNFLIWIGFAACASILLLSVTTFLTQDVAAIPFLWVVPLSVYLLSFILCFESPRFYQRGIFLPLLAASLAFMAYRLSPNRPHIAVSWLIAM